MGARIRWQFAHCEQPEVVTGTSIAAKYSSGKFLVYLSARAVSFRVALILDVLPDILLLINEPKRRFNIISTATLKWGRDTSSERQPAGTHHTLEDCGGF